MPGCHIIGVYPPMAFIEDRVILYNAARLMANRFLRQLPVVDRERRVQGMLAIRDMIRFINSVVAEGAQLVDRLVTTPSIEVARKPVETLTFGAFAVDDVIRIMREKGVGAVPIVDENGRLMGMVNEEHVANIIKNNSYIGAGITVSDIMTSPVTTADVEKTTLRDAVRLMAEGGFRHLPLVDAEGRPVAILTARDVIRFLLRSEVMKLLEEGRDEEVFSKRAVEAASPNPVRVEQNVSLQEALDLMALVGIGGILVVKGGKIVGIVTDMDLVTRLPDKLGDTFYQLLETFAAPCPGKA